MGRDIPAPLRRARMYKARRRYLGSDLGGDLQLSFFRTVTPLLYSSTRVPRELVCVQKPPPRPLLIIAIRYARERRKFDMDEIHEKFPRNGKDTDGRFSRFINSLQLSS